jgi:N-acetylglutamate synthase-like GNAT family acetyltransferase
MFLFFVFALASAKTKNNKKTKYRSAEGRNVDCVSRVNKDMRNIAMQNDVTIALSSTSKVTAVDYTIREATHADTEALRAILAEAGLSAHALLSRGTRYWLAQRAGGGIAGVVGLEYGAMAVLLRSAAVRPDMRGRAIGGALVQQALESATAAGCRYAYLFSTDAGAYWRQQGFRQVPVPELVAALPDAPQVRHYQERGWLPTEVAWRLDL